MGGSHDAKTDAKADAKKADNQKKLKQGRKEKATKGCQCKKEKGGRREEEGCLRRQEKGRRCQEEGCRCRQKEEEGCRCCCQESEEEEQGQEEEGKEMSDFKQSSELLVQQTQNTEMGGGLFMVTPFSHFDSFEC